MTDVIEAGEPSSLPYLLVEAEQAVLAILLAARQPLSTRRIYRELVRQSFFRAHQKGVKVPTDVWQKVFSDPDSLKDKEIIVLVKHFKKDPHFNFPSYDLVKSVVERLSEMNVKFNFQRKLVNSRGDISIVSPGTTYRYETVELMIDGLIKARTYETGKADIYYYANPKLDGLEDISPRIFSYYISPSNVKFVDNVKKASGGGV